MGEIKEIRFKYHNIGNHPNSKPVLVEITENGCWQVISHKKEKLGYVPILHQKKRYKLHKIMYGEKVGKHITELPQWENGKHEILHSCDCPFCINPNHLRLGTHQENMDDMKNKKRGNRPTGESHYRAQLKKEQVIAIFLNKNDGQKELAKRYAVSTYVISDIRRGKSWKSITKDLERPQV